MAFPCNGWQEKAYITITEKGGSDYEFMAYSEDIKIKFGSKDFDLVHTLGDAVYKKYSPVGETTVTISLYAIKGADEPAITQLFFGDTSDTTQPISVDFSKTRKEVRLAVLWTEASGISSATDAVSAGEAATRVVLKEGEIIDFDLEFATDTALKGTVTIKFPPYDCDGNKTINVESTDGSDASGLSALSSY